MISLSLSLSLHTRSFHSWQWRITGYGTQGGRVEQGWEASCVNGLSFIGPFVRCYDLAHTQERVRGKAARRIKANMIRRVPSYKREKRGALWSLFSLPFLVLSFLVTLITLPLYLILWIIWFVIASFWRIAFHCARLALKLVGRDARRQMAK